MVQRIDLEIGPGSVSAGFPVSLTLYRRGRFRAERYRGRLPAVTGLQECYEAWQRAYLAWGSQLRQRRLEIPAQTIRGSTLESFLAQTADLEQRLRDWFNAPEFFQLWGLILKQVRSDQPAKVLIHTQDPFLQKLPWHYWTRLLEDFPRLEIVLSHRPLGASRLGSRWGGRSRLHDPVRILAVLGSSEGLAIEIDLQQIQALPAVAVTPLVQPTAQQLREALDCQPWDIFFFAGHSLTADGVGQIVLNDQGETLTLQELRFTLSHAVRRGLQLAIFNSCDGLGLAQELQTATSAMPPGSRSGRRLGGLLGGLLGGVPAVTLPAMLVMGEAISDQAAQTFLQSFLTPFAQGELLHQALRQARERLWELDRQDRRKVLNPADASADLPAAAAAPYHLCAHWLPVLFQAHEAPELSWPQRQHRLQPILAGMLGLVALGLLGSGAYNWQQWTQLQAVASRVSAGEEPLFAAGPSSAMTAGVQAFAQQQFPQAQQQFQQTHAETGDNPEALIYANNAAIAALPLEQRLEVAASLPIRNNPEIAQQILRGIAQWQQEVNGNGGIHQRKIWVWLANDQNNQPDAQGKRWGLAIAQYLSQHTRTIAVIGPNSSDAATAVAPTFQTQGLVMISPTATSRDLPTYLPYIFRTAPENGFLAGKLAEYALSQSQDPHVLICADRDSSNGHQFAEAFSNELNRAQNLRTATRATEVKTIDCNLAAQPFQPEPIVAALKQERVDTVLLSPGVDRLEPAIALLRAAKAAHVSFTALGSPTLDTVQTLKLGGEATHGLIIFSPYVPADKDQRLWLQKARQLWPGRITWRTAFAYDAGKAIATALAQLPPEEIPSRQRLQQALRRPHFEALGGTGDIQFSAGSGNRTMGLLAGTLIQAQARPESRYSAEFVPIRALEDLFSSGERTHLDEFQPRSQPYKQLGSQAFGQRQFAQAQQHFQAALAQAPDDPEARIYLNNAQINAQIAADPATKVSPVTIAVSLPIGTINAHREISQDMLRGIAQVQETINRSGGLAGHPLRILIADDANDPEQAQAIAQFLVKQPDVIGVVGPFTSDVSLKAAAVYTKPLYGQQRLPLVSLSTTVALSGLSPYVFRTAPSNAPAAKALVDALRAQGLRQVAVFFDSTSRYSQSLTEEFTRALALAQGKAIDHYDFSDPQFNAARRWQTARQQGAEAIALFPNASSLNSALQVVSVNQNQLPLFSGDAVYDPTTLAVGQTHAVGMTVAVPWVPPSSDCPVLAQYRQVWGQEMQWTAALSYEAVQAIATAYSQSASPSSNRQTPSRSSSRQAIQQQMRTPGFKAPGVCRSVQFQANGDVVGPGQLVRILASPTGLRWSNYTE